MFSQFKTDYCQVMLMQRTEWLAARFLRLCAEIYAVKSTELVPRVTCFSQFSSIAVTTEMVPLQTNKIRPAHRRKRKENFTASTIQTECVRNSLPRALWYQEVQSSSCTNFRCTNFLFVASYVYFGQSRKMGWLVSEKKSELIKNNL